MVNKRIFLESQEFPGCRKFEEKNLKFQDFHFDPGWETLFMRLIFFLQN